MWGVPAAPPMNYLTQPFKPSMPKALDLSLALLLITSHLIHSQGILTFVQVACACTTRMFKVILCLLFFQCVTVVGKVPEQDCGRPQGWRHR